MLQLPIDGHHSPRHKLCLLHVYRIDSEQWRKSFKEIRKVTNWSNTLEDKVEHSKWGFEEQRKLEFLFMQVPTLLFEYSFNNKL